MGFGFSSKIHGPLPVVGEVQRVSKKRSISWCRAGCTKDSRVGPGHCPGRYLPVNFVKHCPAICQVLVMLTCNPFNNITFTVINPHSQPRIHGRRRPVLELPVEGVPAHSEAASSCGSVESSFPIACLRIITDTLELRCFTLHRKHSQP